MPKAKRVIDNTARCGPIFLATLITIVGGYFALERCLSLISAAAAENGYGQQVQIVLLYSLIGLMLFANLIYYLSIYGYFRRVAQPSLPVCLELVSIYSDEPRKDLLILIPSYKEEVELIRQALISAALVEYPKRQVILLIDNNPMPTAPKDALLLATTRQLPQELQRLFDVPSRHLERQRAAFRGRHEHSPLCIDEEVTRLAQSYEWASGWLRTVACDFTGDRPSLSHTDRLFIDRILLAPAESHWEKAQELRRGSRTAKDIGQEWRRLSSLFRVEFNTFERKRFVNLSHAPNKAMNLNSYLALIGRGFIEVARPDGLYLEECSDGDGQWQIPDADYVATLDAVSLVTCDYAARLIPVLEQDGHERVAVAQTPYTAIPDPPVAMERAASASTDAQFFSHLGMTYLDSSFWVGASALMRRAALEDIARKSEERGHSIQVYIDDTILIEDAAATIDLIKKNWSVYHYNGRLSYSATPVDFGALLIQRRRWANGGLLILPKLVCYTLRWPWYPDRIAKLFARLPSLMAPSVAGIGMPILLLFRFDDSIVPLWLPLLALTYYLLYGLDLKRAGYQWSDVPRVYALNLLLIPVQFGGTLESLRQAMSGRPIPFRRTPKITGRTRVPKVYLAAICLFCIYALVCAMFDAWDGRFLHMLYAFINGSAAAYGIVVFIGLAAIRDDLFGRSSSGPVKPALADLKSSAGPIGLGPIVTPAVLAPPHE